MSFSAKQNPTRLFDLVKTAVDILKSSTYQINRGRSWQHESKRTWRAGHCSWGRTAAFAVQAQWYLRFFYLPKGLSFFSHSFPKNCVAFLAFELRFGGSSPTYPSPCTLNCLFWCASGLTWALIVLDRKSFATEQPGKLFLVQNPTAELLRSCALENTRMSYLLSFLTIMMW